MKIYHPTYTLNNTIIKCIETISKMQGEMEVISRNIQDEYILNAEANIDAIHYSTKLEGNKLSREQVTKLLTGKVTTKGFGTHRDVKEIINYAKARKFLTEHAEKKTTVTNEIILSTHTILMNGIVEGKLKGHFRDAQNVIQESGSNRIVYLPPEAQDVLLLMKELLAWIKESQLTEENTLMIAALFHYRFVTIHPFMDGNGRLARLITNYLLSSSGYTVSQYAALEKQHEIDRRGYYESLRKLQGYNFYVIPENISLTSWIEYWLLCLEKTYREALARIYKKESNEIAELEPRLQKAISLFKRHIKLCAADYQTLVGLGRTQAIADLNELILQGHISKVGGGRSTIYKFKEK